MKLAALAAVLLPAAASASTLSDLAQSLQPGQWAELRTTGFNEALLGDSNGHHILQFTDDIVWDPNGHQLLFVGGGHGSDAAFIAYSEATNAWRELPLSWGGTFSHAYDHNAIIPGRNTFYHRRPDDTRVWKYDIGAGTWSTTSTFSPDSQCCGALEYFPDLDRLVYVDGLWGVFTYNPASDTWAKVSNALPIGSYHAVAEYSPVHHVLVFGGGGGAAEGAPSNRAVYRMNASGQVSAAASSPINFGIYDTVMTTDPVSGNIILFGDRDSYEYNPATNTWSRFAGAGAFVAAAWTNDSFGSVATPIPEYGVILVATYNFDDSKVFLYRHSPGTASPPAPTVNLQANPMTVATGARTQLAWTSTNATGCTASNGWAGNKAASGNEQSPAINATTVFELACSGAGGTGNDSVTVNTSAAPPPAPTATLTASASSVTLGGSVTLTWSSTNATSCTASGGWTGAKAASGSETLSSLQSTATYSLTCTGSGGTSPPAQTTVTVTGANTDPPGEEGGGALGWWVLTALGLMAARTRTRHGRARPQ